MASWGTITRRTFMIGGTAIAGGVAVGYWYVSKPYPNPLEDGLAEDEATFNPFVKIASDNTITIVAPRAEMGQGISTTLAAFVAEELDVSLDKVKVEHGPTSRAYFNSAMVEEVAAFAAYDESTSAETVRSALGGVGKALGLQRTGSSSSARDGFDSMRQAGAAARTMLMQAAAKRLGVSASELSTDNGTILHKVSGRSLTYGAVAIDAGKIEPPRSLTLKDRKDWKVLGKSQRRVDMLDKVTGAPIFGIDVRLPDMLYGTVLMSPVFGAKPQSADLSKAEKMPGVLKIVAIETVYGHGFGVVASNTWAAFKAAAAIEVKWGPPVHPADSESLMKVIAEAATSGEGSAARNDGDVDLAFAGAPREKVIEAEYRVPYLSHAPMEPMNCTAQLADGKLTLWAPNQTPTLIRWLCSDLAGVTQDNTTVHTTAMGGAFGRRLEFDYALYATLLGKETGGKPIQVTWTREEEIRHGPYRPAAVAKMRARLGDDDGYPGPWTCGSPRRTLSAASSAGSFRAGRSAGRTRPPPTVPTTSLLRVLQIKRRQGGQGHRRRCLQPALQHPQLPGDRNYGAAGHSRQLLAGCGQLAERLLP